MRKQRLKTALLLMIVVGIAVASYYLGQQQVSTQIEQNDEQSQSPTSSQIDRLRHSASTALSKLMNKQVNNAPVSTADQSCDEQLSLDRAKLCTYLIKTDLGHGSGFAVDSNHIVTNKHVVQSASQINTWIDEQQTSLTLWNFSDKSDLAILYSENSLFSCNLDDSDSMPLAATVYAVGWPQSPEGESSVTKGIFSRYVLTKEGPTFIQTDAAINPGNSGGPLVSACGVVGVNTAKVSWSSDDTPSEGFSLAITSNYLKQVVEKLIEEGFEHNLPVNNMGEVEYNLDQQRITPAPPRTEHIYTQESKESWQRAQEVTQELKSYWLNTNEYLNTSRYEQLKDIIARMESVLAVTLPKIEHNKPLSTEERQLLESWQEMYVQAVKLEGELHARDYTQGYGHRRCRDYACVLVSGRGIDQCESNEKCAPSFYYKCEGLTCTVAEGDGENECTSHDDCYYYTCEDQKCIKKAGDGEDRCYYDWQCQ